MWPSHPKDLRELFPCELGKLVASCYRTGHVALEHNSSKYYSVLVASFTVAYTNDLSWSSTKDRVWILCRWPRSRGQLLKIGEPDVLHGRPYLCFGPVKVTYERFKQKYGFLKRLAHSIGHLPPKR